MIDVSYRYKQADLRGGKMMMDPETGVITLVGAEDDTGSVVQQPVPVPVEQEQQLVSVALPPIPIKKVTKSGKA